MGLAAVRRPRWGSSLSSRLRATWSAAAGRAPSLSVLHRVVHAAVRRRVVADLGSPTVQTGLFPGALRAPRRQQSLCAWRAALTVIRCAAMCRAKDTAQRWRPPAWCARNPVAFPDNLSENRAASAVTQQLLQCKCGAPCSRRGAMRPRHGSAGQQATTRPLLQRCSAAASRGSACARGPVLCASKYHGRDADRPVTRGRYTAHGHITVARDDASRGVGDDDSWRRRALSQRTGTAFRTINTGPPLRIARHAESDRPRSCEPRGPGRSNQHRVSACNAGARQARVQAPSPYIHPLRLPRAGPAFEEHLNIPC